MDEGEYAWASPNAECSLRRVGDNLSFRAGTYSDKNQEITVCFNGKEEASVSLDEVTETYYVRIPKECEGQTIRVALHASSSFVPAEENEASSDTRDLAFRVYEIAVE